ncbi:MAG: CRISPR-associated protein Cas5 [Deltaproteobacteria bacterium]|nr:CRISPR-associated protein Cas5 [Deltaproteobacteria bacterium]
MKEIEYPVQFEISGPYAMFTRPDTGSAFVSYPAPTWSACKGMFEAVARLKSAYIYPIKVEICASVNFHRYMTNYGGPLRKSDVIRKGSSYQLGAYVLVDVCYRVYGVVREYTTSPDPRVNHCHYLQDLFNRRLEKGRFWDTPCLGWREFVPNYMGTFRPQTIVETSINEFIPSMLLSPFDQDVSGNSRDKQGNNLARYTQKGVFIQQGVLHYDK